MPEAGFEPKLQYQIEVSDEKYSSKLKGVDRKQLNL